MVLIALLNGCIKAPTVVAPTVVAPTVVESPIAQTWPVWMVLELDTNQAVPSTVSDRLSEVAQQHNVTLDLQPIPVDFEHSTIPRSATGPILILETQAEFYAQVNGRFRWEVDVHMDLFDGTEHIVEDLTIPVFHQFHHQRHAEALEAALPTLERKFHALLNEHLQTK